MERIRKGDSLEYKGLSAVVVGDDPEWDDGGRKCYNVCFLEAGEGYAKGEIDWIPVDDEEED
jgi:hypothetical protein